MWAAILKQNLGLVSFFRHKHGIAIAKEAIFLRDCVLIRRHNMIKTGKGTDQHNEGRFRQVEVSDHGIDDLELIPRVDKDIGIAAKGFNALIERELAKMSPSRERNVRVCLKKTDAGERDIYL